MSAKPPNGRECAKKSWKHPVSYLNKNSIASSIIIFVGVVHLGHDIEFGPKVLRKS